MMDINAFKNTPSASPTKTISESRDIHVNNLEVGGLGRLPLLSARLLDGSGDDADNMPIFFMTKGKALTNILAFPGSIATGENNSLLDDGTAFVELWLQKGGKGYFTGDKNLSRDKTLRFENVSLQSHPLL